MADQDTSNIYETRPNKPNFMLVVALSGIVLVAALIAAYFVVQARGKKMIPHGPNPEPNSRLYLPGSMLGGRTC